ncbi:CPBP family intramembrane metalloprotease domain-containing protein [filamentous cyanobacterium CCP5]|nr:CPBP family intramembrane metalloprotease domain-containing protein [filamentous cyanobacterium CCP5]
MSTSTVDLLSPIDWNHFPDQGFIWLTIGGFFIVWFLLWLPLAGLFWVYSRQQPQFPVPSEQKIPLLVSLYLLAPGLLWLYAHQANTTLGTYGWQWGEGLFIGVLSGAGCGIAGVGLLSTVQVVGNWSTLQPSKINWLPGIGTAIAVGALTLFVSAVEELVFRGFVVNQLQISYSPLSVLLISSCIFALLHLVWDGPAGAPQLPGLILMGAVLLVARHANGGLLGLPCGLHWGWIWSLAVLDTTGIVTQRLAAPPWLVGRAGQPLTSPLVLGLLATTGALVWSFW